VVSSARRPGGFPSLWEGEPGRAVMWLTSSSFLWEVDWLNYGMDEVYIDFF
jgi:hypothetical protein